MREAAQWIDGDSDDDEDDAEEYDDNDGEEVMQPGRLYSIHQQGDMLEFGIDSTIQSVRWDAYWSEGRY